MPVTIDRPAADEYADFYRGYVAAIGEADVLDVLERQQKAFDALRGLTEDRAGYRYAEGKWTIRGVLGHMADAERIFAYRLLRIARGDRTPLPGFEENSFAAASNADARSLDDLLDEIAAIRKASLALVRSLDPAVLGNRAVVNGAEVSARALAFILAGHVQHHLNILRERYAVAV